MKLIKTPQPVMPPVRFMVQLHVMTGGQHGTEPELVYSYAPLQVVGLAKADRYAQELYAHNRWGTAERWPYVTISTVAS